MTKPLASLSLDLDNKWSYLKTHGDRGWEAFPSYLDTVVPCFLDLLERLGLRITVFVVGQDAALDKNRRAIASIADAGHEIGNHSFRHEPWLHLYSYDELDQEIQAAEAAIGEVTGQQPVGFRGPGYSTSPALYACLARRGYEYDASALPTVIGPLARAYYFLTSKLSPEERRQRRRLFGGVAEGFGPLKPYWWKFQAADGEQQRVLEIPVTTMPLLRVPIHFSYLLYLAQRSRTLAWSYWKLAMALCRARRIEPSLLLHPLDVLGGDEERELSFFPAMRMPGKVKRAFIRDVLADFAQRFEVVTLAEHAKKLRQAPGLAVRTFRLADHNSPATGSLAAVPEPALTMEVRP